MDSDPPEGCSGAPMDVTNPFTWRCSVFGPEGTVWEGGVFQLQMQFGADYPQKPPAVRFTSTIYHPNGQDPALLMMLVSRTLHSFGLQRFSFCCALSHLLVTLCSLCVLSSVPRWQSLFGHHPRQMESRVLRVDDSDLDPIVARRPQPC
jgi:ubiquitin-protein ligase